MLGFVTMLKGLPIWFSMVAAVFFASCYISYKPKGVAYLRPYNVDSLEIEIPYTVHGRGNLHAIDFDIRKWSDSDSYWIHLRKTAKVVTADSLLLYDTKGYSSQEYLKGEIGMEDSILTIHLKIPRINNKGHVKRWVNYEFNGEYRMKSKT